MAIEWLDRYSVGDAEIDAQHRTLFGLVNALLAVTDKSHRAEALANLFEHTRYHFKHEEALMCSMDYPGLKAHAEQHQNLLTKLGQTSELIANYSLNMAHLESFLAAWLLKHMETLDMSLAKHIRLK